MTSVSNLRARDYARIAYLLAIEGVPYAWATEDDLIGSSDTPGTWIDLSGEVRSVLGGLSVPDTLEFGVEGSMPVDSGAEFVLHDLDGTVSALFGSAEPEDLQLTEERLPASSSAAPATIQVLGGDSGDLWGRQIGGEAIGPAGERQYYPAIPQAYMPGRHHASTSQQIEGALVPVPITDDPYVLEGRRVALYRLYYDTDQGDWPIWELQYDDGGLIWWGTLRVAGKVEGKAWTIKCDGPESWLRKTLNALAPDTWIQGARPEFILADSEKQIAGWCRKVATTGAILYNGEIILDPAYDITQTDPDGIRQEIDAFLDDLVLDSGIPYSDVPEGDFELQAGSIRIRINVNGFYLGGELHLVLHEKVWLRIGYDPRSQARSNAEIQGPYDVDFNPPVNGGWYAWTKGVQPSDPSGYWEGIFRTRKQGISPDTGNSQVEIANNGDWRVYQPSTPNGVDFLDPFATQKITLGVDRYYLEAQRGRPASDLQIDGNDCDASRWLCQVALFP